MHISVLLEKALEYLDLEPNKNIIDCTLGAGGHTVSILERIAPKGKILAIDWDGQAVHQIQKQERLTLHEGNFADVAHIAQEEKFSPVYGVLFDLGFSSDQIEGRTPGLSFQRKEPLDMRYSKASPVDAAKIVNFSSKAELEDVLAVYGEEQFAKQITEAIVAKRSEKHIETTDQLTDIIEHAVPAWYKRRKIHPATKTFQALRIAVNQELENLERGLQGAAEITEPEGRIVIISFHSLEDRIAKDFFKKQTNLEVITKKPITPSAAEIKQNPRARSAKLRAAKKIS